MGQSLYFDNYTAVGDIIVLAICFVIGILIATSYNTKTKTFKLFVNMIVYLGLAAMSDMILHDYYVHIVDGNYVPICVIRVIYHAILFSLFLIFVVYLVVILNLEKRNVFLIMTLATGCYIVVIISDIILNVTGKGFRIDKGGNAVYGPNVFMIGYVAFVSMIVFLILRYRDRLYQKSVIGMFGSMAVSFFILYNQGRHGQASFTVATFLFPILAVMYLMHSNPYNVMTGTVNASDLKDAVRYHYEKKLDFYFISMYLPDFHAEAKELPAELKAEIRRFAKELSDIIDRSSIPNGRIAIEVTESQTDSDFISLKNMIEKLKDTGIKFYLDDFGTGYSNMERIMNLPFDIIKFDRSLVIASQSDKRSEEIVGKLAGMFAELHYSVLYEGIEDEDDEKRCINMYASYLQGYKYSGPIPIEELRNFFSKNA